jgi:hypothetical protein
MDGVPGRIVENRIILRKGGETMRAAFVARAYGNSPILCAHSRKVEPASQKAQA